MTIVMIY